MMAEFVSIPTQRLKARQFVHPDDNKEMTVKTYSSQEMADTVLGRNRTFFESDGENQKLKRDESRKQLLKYQMENVTAVKDPNEEQEMNDWLENLQLKSQSTSSVLLTSTTTEASIIAAAAFRLKSKIKNKNGNSNTLTKSFSTPIITISDAWSESQEKVVDEQESNQSKADDYLLVEPLATPLKTMAIIETCDKSSINRGKKLLEVASESQHSTEESGNGVSLSSSSSSISNQPLQVKYVGAGKIKKGKKSTKR